MELVALHDHSRVEVACLDDSATVAVADLALACEVVVAVLGQLGEVVVADLALHGCVRVADDADVSGAGNAELALRCVVGITQDVYGNGAIREAPDGVHLALVGHVAVSDDIGASLVVHAVLELHGLVRAAGLDDLHAVRNAADACLRSDVEVTVLLDQHLLDAIGAVLGRRHLRCLIEVSGLLDVDGILAGLVAGGPGKVLTCGIAVAVLHDLGTEIPDVPGGAGHVVVSYLGDLGAAHVPDECRGVDGCTGSPLGHGCRVAAADLVDVSLEPVAVLRDVRVVAGADLVNGSRVGVPDLGHVRQVGGKSYYGNHQKNAHCRSHHFHLFHSLLSFFD